MTARTLCITGYVLAACGSASLVHEYDRHTCRDSAPLTKMAIGVMWPLTSVLFTGLVLTGYPTVTNCMTPGVPS